MSQTEIGFKITIPGIHAQTWITVETVVDGLKFTTTEEHGEALLNTSVIIPDPDGRKLNRLMDLWAEQFP